MHKERWVCDAALNSGLQEASRIFSVTRGKANNKFSPPLFLYTRQGTNLCLLWVMPWALPGPAFRGLVQTPHHGQFLPQGLTIRGMENRCGKAVMSKQRGSTKIGSQLHTGNIRTEPLGREKSSCRTGQSQLVLSRQKSITNAPCCLSLLLLLAPQQPGKARKERGAPGWAMPVQVQSRACPWRDHFVLLFLCFQLQSQPAEHTLPVLLESESLTSLLAVWFLQTIHSKHATEGTAPGDTNIGHVNLMLFGLRRLLATISSRGYKNSFPVPLLELIQLAPLQSTQSQWLHMAES